MTPVPLPTGPDPEAIKRTILELYPETDLVEIPGGAFFSLDPEKHFPNFATIVWADEVSDEASNLSRSGVFRLNLGVTRATFERLVGSMAIRTTRRSTDSSPTPSTRSSSGSRSSTRARRRSATWSCRSSPRRTTGWPRSGRGTGSIRAAPRNLGPYRGVGRRVAPRAPSSRLRP